MATTANFALVVSGVPTSGEKQNASGASGASGSTPAGASSVSSHAPSPAPPRWSRSTRSDSGRTVVVAGADVDDQGAAEVAAAERSDVATVIAHPPASAETNVTASPATSGVAPSRVTRSPLTAATTWRSSVDAGGPGGGPDRRRPHRAGATVPVAGQRPEALDRDLRRRPGVRLLVVGAAR